MEFDIITFFIGFGVGAAIMIGLGLYIVHRDEQKKKKGYWVNGGKYDFGV